MYRVGKRSLSIILIIGIVILGFGVYIVRYIIYGSTWASAPFNRAAYTGGVLTGGTVTDRNGVMLAGNADGKRTFASEIDIRKSTVHAVGDREGNVGTGALRIYAPELMGYNLITGSYRYGNNTGNTIALTIDSKLNLEAYKALGGRRGVVMVSNYKTGEILCMVSSPSFDPADPPVNVDEETGIYLNRGIQAAYTPGSTFKLVTAAAAIENIDDIYEREFICTGELVIGNDTLICNGVHNTLGFVQALRVSCNIAFGQIALELGAETISKYADMYGISGSTDIGSITTMSGNFDIAAPGTVDLAWSGIGQYTDMVNPAVMLRFAGAIANEGVAYQLQLLGKTGLSGLFQSSSKRLMPAETARQLGVMMEIQNRDSFPGLLIHAKSGTAQVGSDKEPHAWYAGYITNPGHPYAFVVVVENGGGGTAVAAPIAGRVLQSAVKD